MTVQRFPASNFTMIVTDEILESDNATLPSLTNHHVEIKALLSTAILIGNIQNSLRFNFSNCNLKFCDTFASIVLFVHLTDVHTVCLLEEGGARKTN